MRTITPRDLAIGIPRTLPIAVKHARQNELLWLEVVESTEANRIFAEYQRERSACFRAGLRWAMLVRVMDLVRASNIIVGPIKQQAYAQPQR